MNVPRITFIVCSLCMAGAALAAAYYWFRSSLATPVESSDIAASISDNEALYTRLLDGKTCFLRVALTSSSAIFAYANCQMASPSGVGASSAIPAMPRYWLFENV